MNYANSAHTCLVVWRIKQLISLIFTKLHSIENIGGYVVETQWEREFAVCLG